MFLTEAKLVNFKLNEKNGDKTPNYLQHIKNRYEMKLHAFSEFMCYCGANRERMRGSIYNFIGCLSPGCS